MQSGRVRQGDADRIVHPERLAEEAIDLARGVVARFVGGEPAQIAAEALAGEALRRLVVAVDGRGRAARDCERANQGQEEAGPGHGDGGTRCEGECVPAGLGATGVEGLGGAFAGVSLRAAPLSRA